MSNTENTQHEDKPDSADPYGVDHAKERRLFITLAALVGGGFILVIIMLAVAITLDFKAEGPVIDPPPIIPDPQTLDQGDTPINHP